MTFFIETLKDVLNAINFFIEHNEQYFTIRRIREYYQINPFNQGKITLIQNILNLLEKKEFIEFSKENKSSSIYKIPNLKFNIPKIIKELI